MVKLAWKTFGIAGDEPDEENAETGPLKDVSKCECLAKLGNRVVAGFLFVYDHVPFRHLLPILVLILYTIFGGWLFRRLEHDAFLARTRPALPDVPAAIRNGTDNRSVSEPKLGPLSSRDLTALESQRLLYRKEMARRLWRLNLNNTTPKVRERMVEGVWAWYDSKTVQFECPKQTGVKSESPWTMWNAMFYATTLYTTIGYGNIAPVTTGGRVATIIYALFGIPLVLTILNDWGMLLFRWLKYLHCQYMRFKHRRNAWIPMAGEPEDVADLPGSLAVFLLIFWLCTCAGIFLIWEDDWNYFTSFYFFFISLTTIGLGDVVPRYPQYTLMSFTLVLCGLSVVSMSFNIIQTKIESLFRSLMLGIEQEYWQKQVEPDKSQFGEDGSPVNASMGVMQLWKNKPLKQRILFRLMDKSKKQMLQDYWEKKANTRNQSTQTIIKTFATEALQVELDVEEAEERYKRNRKYIYNLGD